MKEIELRNGGITLIDDDDFEKVSKHKWRKNSRGYIIGNIAYLNRQIYLHRFVLGVENEKGGREVDHKNRNKADNRKENLRLCSRAENVANCKTLNKSGYKGVSIRNDGKYEARISYLIGVFDRIEDAAEARRKEAIKIYGEFAE